ncbi:MAG: methyltransferase domain-containing protein [Oceanospirillaceae bacterium]|nr:methyltransferase domain-containing protein [Oceanospirillaceae bacterium]MCP5350095.1 methyltransferase domain-containing protein [Oceanospirillaceae bacterium]
MATAQLNRDIKKPRLIKSDLKILKAEALNLLGLSRAEHLASQASLDYLHNALQISRSILRSAGYQDNEAVNLFARIALELGLNEEARDALQQGLEIHPEAAELWHSSGFALIACHAWSDAENAFRKAIKLAPGETRAESGLAYCLLEQHKVVEAFQIYRELAKTQADDGHIRSKLLESASTLSADYYDPELEQDVLEYLAWQDCNTGLLSNLVCSLLQHKFALNEEGTRMDFKGIACDPLLQKALHNILIKSALLERLIMGLRHGLLTQATQHGVIEKEFLPLAIALNHYGLNSQFILPQSRAETDMLDMLRNILNESLQQSSDPAMYEGALILWGMYQPWWSLEARQYLPLTQLALWPAHCFSILNRCLEHEHEQELADNIISLTSEPKGTSRRVQNQYETYPYPRWLNMDFRHPTDYAQALAQELPHLNTRQSLRERPLNILIAGCGTGRHALHVARYFRDVNVTAVDLSRQSLAYAQKMADKFAIANVNFYQADLLQLQQPDWQFDIVECSGVLHHIRESDQALQNLLSLMKPNGLIKMGLYSQRARTPIYDLRDALGDRVYDVPSLKMIRQGIHASANLKNKERITQADDFYSMSGCMDLLFHQFEKTYTPLSLSRLLNKHKLTFRGFVRLPDQLKHTYRQMFPTDTDMLNLKNWDVLEQKYPDAFTGMYQFYAQKQK